MYVVSIKSDGASVPNFLRKYIINRFGQEKMDRIDWCGYRHDGRVECDCMTEGEARAFFFVDLVCVGIPIGLIEVIYIGLTVYDRSPRFLQCILDLSVDKKNQPTVIINLKLGIDYETNRAIFK